jgi:hypothetical protein
MTDNREGVTKPWSGGGAGLNDAGPDGVTRPASSNQYGAAGRNSNAGASNGDPKTIPVGAQRTPDMAEAFDPMRDPVVAWLVIVSGVGKGTHRPLGYGQNIVGRGEDARVKLVYGAAFTLKEGATQEVDVGLESHYDGSIARKHFVITYDIRTRKYFVQNSQESTNLTYIKGEDDPLMSPREIKSFDRIQIGNTELMFVALCHRGADDEPGFDWKDT